MRLHAVVIKNWACIEALQLDGLKDGVVVLHGPNQTGKSSLVEALRCCLFDLDHNSAGQRLANAVPRGSRALPEVSVEIDIGKDRFRIAKAFSKNKDGYARVEQHSAGAWRLIENGKQANQKIRELVGAEKSTSGLFQLLWLPQGDIRLPDEPDPALAKSLEAILGSLITGPDLDFKARLDKACERWFTPTMQDKKASPVLALQTKLKDAKAHHAEIERQWRDAEDALKQYADALATRPELTRRLKEAEDELALVTTARETIVVRQQQYEWAVTDTEQCAELHAQAAARLAQRDEAEKQLAEAVRTHADLQARTHSEEEASRVARDTLAQAKNDVAQAEDRLAEHQQGRPVLEDRQRLAQLGERLHGIQKDTESAQRLESECRGLEQDLAELTAPAPEQIQALRRAAEKAAKLRTQLEAAEIEVSIEAAPPLEVQVDADGKPLTPAPASVLFRQHAEIRLGELATIRIRRARDDRDVETSARELADLEQQLRDADVDPRDASALDELVTRRARHDALAEQLLAERTRLAEAAPDGMPALAARLEQIRDEQQRILARRPELRSASSDQTEMDRLRRDFDAAEATLAQIVQERKSALHRLTAAAQKSADQGQAIRDQLARTAAQVQVFEAQIGRTERATLVEDCTQTEQRLLEAKGKAEAAALTEAERDVETRYQSALHARAQRASRLRENDDLLLELKTKLIGAEGLHQKRTHAEQAVNEVDRALQRESADAEAHKHLKDLFERLRGEQVRRAVGPINDRVTRWTQQLGLIDCAGLDFGDRLLPNGLVSSRVLDEPMTLVRESYGTQEQLSILIRLAVGGLLAREEPAVAILDDPLAHADDVKHRRMLDLFTRAVQGEPTGPHPTGPLQLIILTCHAERFDHLQGAQQIDLARLIKKHG